MEVQEASGEVDTSLLPVVGTPCMHCPGLPPSPVLEALPPFFGFGGLGDPSTHSLPACPH